MLMNRRLCGCVLTLAFCAGAAWAQDAKTPNPPASRDISLDVVVTPKSGAPVSDLTQQQFTVLDNKAPQTINSFRAVRGREAPIEVLVVIDDVNAGLSNVAFQRSEIDKFLRTDAGRLAYPTALAFLTDAGVKIQGEFLTDGNALSASLDQYTAGLHSIIRAGGVYSEFERYQISVQALLQLAARDTQRPGRKLILWISPGWPLLSGPGLQQQLTNKQQQQIFDTVVQLSGLLRQGEVTLYSIDPLSSGSSPYRDFLWENFAKGISKPSQAVWGNLGLQVIATQSGGVAFPAENDITGLLQRCISDAQTYYELSFTPAAGGKPNEYHHLEVRVSQSGLVARTRQGYYSQP
jgi:VWFA-related protein